MSRNRVEQGIVELKAAYDEGVRVFLDVTTFDLGRNIGLMEEAFREAVKLAGLLVVTETAASPFR